MIRVPRLLRLGALPLDRLLSLLEFLDLLQEFLEVLQLVEGHFLHELRFLDFLDQFLPGFLQGHQGRLLRRQGRFLARLRRSALSQRGPGFLHRRDRSGQGICHLGNKLGKLLPQEIRAVHQLRLVPLQPLRPTLIANLRSIQPHPFTRSLNLLLQTALHILNQVRESDLLLGTGVFQTPLQVGDLFLQDLDPFVLEDQFLCLGPLPVIQVPGLSDDLLLSPNQFVKFLQTGEEPVERIAIRLQDHDQAPQDVARALLVAGRAHQPIALEIEKGRLQGRRQLVLRHEGKSVPGTFLQRALEGLLHVRQRGKNQADFLLQRFLFGFLQAPRNRKVILPAGRRGLPRCRDQCHRLMQVG